MNAQFKKGIIELCVLSVLVEKDNYGYDIINELYNHINVSENSIYPILKRLTDDGYFRTYLVESKEGAPRKYYQMTEKGFIFYLSLRDEWDQFIGGVYQVISKGGKKNDEIFRRFKERIEKEEHQ